MSTSEHASASLRTAISMALLCAGLMLPAQTTRAQDSTAPESQELEEVVVTGFRGSLNTALAQKRTETASVDVIASEDIGKFPDSNLAESMQRIPSVALSRGDGGEGKNISVRGLGPTFTRVRINGMEGSAQTGASDIYGAGNNGRSFDFNVFPTEIFSQLAVRKTMSADVEEGSLGATVDLRAPRPLDLADDTVFTITGRGIYNDVSEDMDPRASALFSKKFFDDKFGILLSGAYQERHSREVGYSAVDVLAASSNANNIAVTPMGGPVPPGIYLPYCTPIGWTTTAPSPVPGTRGTTAANCSAGAYGVNPRTSDLAAFTTVYNMTSPGIVDPVSHVPIPGGGAFFPRLPRYVNSEQDTSRTGGTLSMQWAPGENTKLSLDGLYSRYAVVRRDNYIAGISTGRNLTNNGQPMTSIRAVTFDDKGSVQSATFDGMDVRSEGLVDNYIATFKQANLDFEHAFSDSFKITASAGRSLSVWDGPKRLQTFIDAIDVDNFTIDFSGRETPLIGFGFDVSNPANFTYAATPDSNQTVVGGYSFQGKPSRNVTANTLFELAGDWQMNDAFKLKGGLQWRQNNFKSHVSGILAASTVTQNLPAGTTLADYTLTIDDLDSKFGAGAPASWVAMDPKKWAETFNYPAAFNFCGIECGANRSQMLEEITGAFAMLAFNTEWGIPVRGDVGVRYVNTRQSAVGYIPIAAPMGAPFPNVGFRQDVDQEYHDLLPSLNMVFEFTPDLLMRFSAAKVMARADLGSLSPSVSVTATTHTASVNNPLLEPIRAKTADLALEWYFAEGSLLSAAVFYKDIETYIQRITGDEPFRNLGVPDSVLAGSPSSPTDTFQVSRLQNTEGGPLKGFELNAQVQFRNLPGFWSNTGFLANYTHVESTIKYVLTSAGGVPLTFTEDDLVDLSPNTASGTLFYDNGTVSVRTTGSYRDAYIRGLPASAGSDVRGNKANMFVDASASWNVNDNLSLILEAQNLTDERNTLFIDRSREDTLFQTEIGRTFTIGATFKF
ncbi:MAG TPA: TonB-dependent receptor [Steroidobacteraceae bacterium]|jgi:TonB-dependent receptor|nr:TonB-dependent receptor [Steroidobacteraceae bacterium]